MWVLLQNKIELCFTYNLIPVHLMNNGEHEREEELRDNYEISVGGIFHLGIFVGVSLGELVLYPDFCDV